MSILGSIKSPKIISPYPMKLLKCCDCDKISAENKFTKYTNIKNKNQM